MLDMARGWETKSGSSPARLLRRVALVVESSNTHGRGLLEGIVNYGRGHANWTLQLGEHARGGNPPSWLRSWKGDGIIARVENQATADAIMMTGLPAVDLSAARLLPTAPTVETHDRVIASQIADHMIERGLRQFAFCGDSRYPWSRYRQHHFETLVQARGFACHSFNPQSAGDIAAEQEAIAQWLKHLPRPIGIMTCYDVRAQQLLEICRSQRIHVPDDVAVAGVDNEPLLCQLASPPLTSVALNSRRMGFLAASLLDRMMAGEAVPPDVHLVEPIGLVCRQSTDLAAVEDPFVTAALAFIRAHACERITVADILHEVPISRRALESRFKALLGRSPHKEILRLRMSKIQELLRDTDLTLHAIADLTGFEHAEYLSVAFKREQGIWPRQFREQSRRPLIVSQVTYSGSDESRARLPAQHSPSTTDSRYRRTSYRSATRPRSR